MTKLTLDELAAHRDAIDQAIGALTLPVRTATDRQSVHYKLGYCIGSLERILNEITYLTNPGERIKQIATDALTAIGHEPKS